MAWTGNFKDQIDDLAGILATTDDVAIQQWLVDACYDVLDKAVLKFGDDEIWKFVAKSSDQTANAIDIDEIRTVAAVVRDGKFATKGKWQLKSKYADAASVYYATDNNPIWYVDDSALSVYPPPAAGGSDTVNYYYIPEYAITSWNASTSSINNFPSEYYYYVMLYASLRVLYRRMVDYAEPTAISDLIIAAVPPDEIPDPAIVAPSVVSLTAPVITANAPTYTPPAMASIQSFQEWATAETYSLDNLSITSVPPDTPVLDVVAYTALDTVTVGSTTDMADPGAISVSSISAADSNIPVYTAPTVQGGSTELSQVTAGTLGSAETDFDEWFHVAGQYIEDEEDTELAGSQIQKISTYLSAWSTQMQSNLNAFNDANVEYQAKIQQDTQNIQATNQAVIQDIGNDMAILQANLQKDIGEAQFNAANAQAKAVQDSLQTVQAIISENQSKMTKYQAEVGTYQAEVNTEVQEYSTNLQKMTQTWTTEQANELSNVGQLLQDKLNIFNEENVLYQAHVQSVMAKFQADLQDVTKDADFDMQKQIQNYTLELQKWQSNVANYQAEVNTQVTEYANNLQKFASALQASTTSYAWLEAQYGKLKVEYDSFFASSKTREETPIGAGPGYNA